jgi:SNF2 family DNA or RNA helicase
VIQTDAQSGLEKMYANAQEFLASLHPAPQPKYMHTVLLDHQKIGLAWLLHQESQMRRGAILADDMGLGKTIMTLALIAATHDNPHKDGNRTLIVCPVSTVEHWRAEIDRHLIKENFRVAVFHGSSKKTENMEAMDILITTYGTVNALSKHEHNFFSGHSWARIILDEAHVIKNRKTQTAKNIGKLRAHRLRLAITGTPIQNTLDDLYSLLTFLRHPEYQDTKKWKAEIAAPVANSDPVGINRLQTLLGSVMLRRRKDMMINGQPIISLPRVITEEVTLSFTNQEQRFYDFAESELLAWVKKANFEAKIIQTDLWNILEKLLRVRQACNHPYLLLMGLAPFRYKVGSLYKTALLRTDFERVIAAAASNSAHPQSISDIISGGSPPTIKHPRCRHCEIDAVVPHVSGCGHEFCRDCITELIGTVSSCPVCGRALKTSKPMILDTHSEPTLQTAPSQDLESGVDGDDDDSDDGSDSDDSDDSEDELGNQDSKSSPNNPVDVVSPSQDDDAMNVDPAPPPAANQPLLGAPRTFGALTAASMRSVSAMKPKAPPRFTPKIPPGRALAPRPATAAPASIPPSSFGSPLASKDSKQESIMDVSDSSSDSFDAFSRSTTALDFLPDSMPELALYAKGIFKPMIPGEPPLRSIMRPEDLPPPPPPVKETEEETKPGAKSKKNQKKKQPKPPEKDAVIDDFDRSEVLLSSTKIDALLSRVVKMRADDPTGKAVIYSQFVGFLDLIQAKMTSAGLRVCRLDGKMSLEQRQRSIDELKDSNSCVAILVSLKAGGVGINLTAANHVFLMDPWWNPMIEQYALFLFLPLFWFLVPLFHVAGKPSIASIVSVKKKSSMFIVFWFKTLSRVLSLRCNSVKRLWQMIFYRKVNTKRKWTTRRVGSALEMSPLCFRPTTTRRRFLLSASA